MEHCTVLVQYLHYLQISIYINDYAIIQINDCYIFSMQRLQFYKDEVIGEGIHVYNGLLSGTSTSTLH